MHFPTAVVIAGIIAFQVFFLKLSWSFLVHAAAISWVRVGHLVWSSFQSSCELHADGLEKWNEM